MSREHFSDKVILVIVENVERRIFVFMVLSN